MWYNVVSNPVTRERCFGFHRARIMPAHPPLPSSLVAAMPQ